MSLLKNLLLVSILGIGAQAEAAGSFTITNLTNETLKCAIVYWDSYPFPGQWTTEQWYEIENGGVLRRDKRADGYLCAGGDKVWNSDVAMRDPRFPTEYCVSVGDGRTQIFQSDREDLCQDLGGTMVRFANLPEIPDYQITLYPTPRRRN